MSASSPKASSPSPPSPKSNPSISPESVRPSSAASSDSSSSPISSGVWRRIGEHLGRLLERGGREEGVGSERRLGDAEDDLLVLGQLLLLLRQLRVDAEDLVAIHELAREVGGVAL